jgi:hypothetical protein
MTSHRASIAAVVTIGAIFAGSCGDSGDTGPSSAAPVSVETAYSNLESREGAHHRTALDATDQTLLRGETRRYAADMDSLMNAMMDSCFAIDSNHMMGGHDMGGMRGMSEWMDDVIERHRARMDSLLTLEEMRAECAEHHEEMLDLLDQVHDALPTRMGGGMMGGGMH